MHHHLCPDDELERVLFGGDVRTHDPGERALVGDCQRGVAQLRRTFDQLLGVRGAAQEAEVGEAVQLGVGGGHGGGQWLYKYTAKRRAAKRRSSPYRKIPGIRRRSLAGTRPPRPGGPLYSKCPRREEADPSCREDPGSGEDALQEPARLVYSKCLAAREAALPAGKTRDQAKMPCRNQPGSPWRAWYTQKRRPRSSAATK